MQPNLTDYGWIGCASQLVEPKRLPGFFFSLQYFILFFFRYETIVLYVLQLSLLIYFCLGSVDDHERQRRGVLSQRSLVCMYSLSLTLWRRRAQQFWPYGKITTREAGCSTIHIELSLDKQTETQWGQMRFIASCCT